MVQCHLQKPHHSHTTNYSSSPGWVNSVNAVHSPLGELSGHVFLVDGEKLLQSLGGKAGGWIPDGKREKWSDGYLLSSVAHFSELYSVVNVCCLNPRRILAMLIIDCVWSPEIGSRIYFLPSSHYIVLMSSII